TVQAGSCAEAPSRRLARRLSLLALPSVRAAPADLEPAPSPLLRRRLSPSGRGRESGAGTLGKLSVDLPGSAADRAHPGARPERGRGRAEAVPRRPGPGCRAEVGAGAPHLDGPAPG